MPTYIYLGHGSECIIDKEGIRVPNRRPTIPPGCTLSTITESGVNSRGSDIERLMRMSNVKAIRDLMANPRENEDLLSSIFEGVNNEFLESIPEYSAILKLKETPVYNVKRIGHEEYHLKIEGMPYSDRSISFLLYDAVENNEDRPIIIDRSGIYDIETAPPSLDEYKITVSQTKPSVTVDQFVELYRDSVFPTQEQIRTECQIYPEDYKYNFWELFDIIQHITEGVFQSTLMQKLPPGNHYNFSCRGHRTKNVSAETTARVRRNSLTSQNRPRRIRNVKLLELIEIKKKEQEEIAKNIPLMEHRLRMFASSGRVLSAAQIQIIKDAIKLIQKLPDMSIISNPAELIANIEHFSRLHLFDDLEGVDIAMILSRLQEAPHREGEGGRRTRKMRSKRHTRKKVKN